MQDLLKCTRCSVLPVFFLLYSNGRQHKACMKCLCCGQATNPHTFTADAASTLEAVDCMYSDWNAMQLRRKFSVIRRHRRAGRKAAAY